MGDTSRWNELTTSTPLAEPYAALLVRNETIRLRREAMKASSCLRLSIGALMFTVSSFALAENAVTTEPASVRAGPDSSYPEVANLDADSPIQVMGCLDDWSWCDVAFDGNRGWLYSPDITYQYQGGYVPLYSYAPALGVPVLTFSIDSYWGSHYHDRSWYAQREEWVHRPIHHQRPSGPPPSASPPPRQAIRMDRQNGPGSPADHSIRLGHADPAHPGPDRHEAGRPDGAAAHDAGHVEPRSGPPRSPDHRPQENSPPPAAQRAEVNPKQAQHAPPQPERAAPQHQEAHPQPAGHAEPPHHQEQHGGSERPEGPPHF
jgi:uncharacterized protein YraI